MVSYILLNLYGSMIIGGAGDSIMDNNIPILTSFGRNPRRMDSNTCCSGSCL